MLLSKVVVDETSEHQALRQDLAHGGGQPIRSVIVWGAVILCNKATHRHPRKVIEQRQHRLPDGSADVLEVDVDTVWTSDS